MPRSIHRVKDRSPTAQEHNCTSAYVKVTFLILSFFIHFALDLGEIRFVLVNPLPDCNLTRCETVSRCHFEQHKYQSNHREECTEKDDEIRECGLRKEEAEIIDPVA